MRKTSYVYFIKDSSNGLVKIGKSVTPHKRLKILQIGSSNKLQLVKIVKGGMYLEQILHRYFKSIRIQGEWFKPDYELKQFLLGRNITISGIYDIVENTLSRSERKYLQTLETTRLYL